MSSGYAYTRVKTPDVVEYVAKTLASVFAQSENFYFVFNFISCLTRPYY